MKVNKKMLNFSRYICSIVLLIAPVTMYSCRLFFYQPMEPEGLERFILEHKKK